MMTTMMMESGSSGLFLLLLLLLLTSGASGLGSVLWIGFNYYSPPYTWKNAQSFCRRWASYSHYHQQLLEGVGCRILCAQKNNILEKGEVFTQ